ncbi:MAG: hypothetical protein HFF93_10085 [Oscillibacter sp.]|nr:hypothetical protein [Oscillibacter sp.]
MFDGISCGRVALDRVGIMPEVYFASEIDEYAEQVSADNWPDLVRLGDAKGVDGWDLGRIDLLLGGSPCTNWSITKKEGRELTASGTGWELFSFYVKALQKFEPKYFLYENVKSMSPAIRAEITRALGVEPILINSGLVSAQNRERLYWTNIPGVGQPEDRRITFGEILERGRTWREKAYTLRASHGLKGGPYSILRSIKTPGQFSFNGVAEFAAEGDGTAAYEVRNGYITIKGERYPLKLPDGNYRFRKLTKTENCRLQTLPDNYCKSVSDAQVCKTAGNGWTVDVIAHILGNIPKGDCYTMKAIVMTTQDAREFEKLGGLTITKPIRPVPVTYCKGLHLMEREPGNWLLVGGDNDVDRAEKFSNWYRAPVKAGDIVFLREPWHRLIDPTTKEPSGRVILAADSTVAEGQTAYKWSSPVSMPESAARRFAVVSKVEPIYNANVAVWSITLEAVTKAAAEAGEAGALPYSDAPSPEEGSSYYTYAGDMSPEDHQLMVDAINQDRARLAEVQDRIIQLDSLRRELDSRAAPSEEYVPLGEEGLALIKEEADLRLALEDAGAPAPTTADHAREKLAAIRSRRAEIAAADQKDRVFEDLDGEDENLAAEERGLSAYLEGLAAAEDGPTGEEPPAGDGEQTTLDTQEDEEVGSFNFGKCNYCGREWGVTLEGAKGGGYPTQRTANAAATRVCDCPEAVENRKPEVGVAFAVTTGACKYCGQLQEVGPHPSQAAADETATEVCSCPSARTARRTAEQIEDARDRVNRLFGERAEDLGFKPIAGDGAIELLERVVELIARGPISSASLNIRGQCKAKFSITSKGKIKVSRSETRIKLYSEETISTYRLHVAL